MDKNYMIRKVIYSHRGLRF